MRKIEITRRDFIKGISVTGTLAYLNGFGRVKKTYANGEKSQLFCVENCPVHDGHYRHVGMDALIDVLAMNGLKLFRTNKSHRWGSPQGVIDVNDVVLIKVNCQWKCRGTTNTDALRGLIYRILQHPDGFKGEIVIFENGQGRGGFDGILQGGSSYDAWPDIADNIHINAEEETLLTVDYLVHTVFKDYPVSSFLLDPVRSTFIASDDYVTDGYRIVSDISYPCFTSSGGNRIELYEGIWNGSEHAANLKLINFPVFKHHGGTGVTGSLKHVYGILSMSDGYSNIRHYNQSGIQCGKMIQLVRVPDLNIIDCIWVSHESLRGYPPATTYRTNKLVAGIDPVALDYYASKHILYPLGGSLVSEHDPDTFNGLINHLAGAMNYINSNGGIGGNPVQTGDDNIYVHTVNAQTYKKAKPWIPLLLLDS